MPLYHFLDPVRFGVESIYSLIILFLCLLVFFKTKEIYDLTKHKGIQFFRYAFLFFGLAYASRLILYVIIMSNGIDFFRYGRNLMPLSHLVVAYFSTMAILYLVYSMIWKKINAEHFLIFSNIVAISIAVIAFVFRSPIIVSFIQLLLLICAGIIILGTGKKDKKKFNTKALYLLIFLFWIINLVVLESTRLLLFEIKVAFQLISIVVFIAIYYKVKKWVK